MRTRTKFVIAIVLGFICGARLAMADDDIYTHARPPIPTRVVRLDVVKKRVTPPLRYSLGRRCPPEVPARLWLKQQLARINTVTFSPGDVVLNMSDGREVHTDDLLAPTPRDPSIQGFFNPTTQATFYAALYGKIAIVGVLVRDGVPCGESWTLPVIDESL